MVRMGQIGYALPATEFSRVCVMKTLMNRLVREQKGQDLIEYGLLLGIITVAALVGIQAIGPKVGSYFSNLNTTLP
jgi:pilus assembly protein Flp/PilA